MSSSIVETDLFDIDSFAIFSNIFSNNRATAEELANWTRRGGEDRFANESVSSGGSRQSSFVGDLRLRSVCSSSRPRSTTSSPRRLSNKQSSTLSKKSSSNSQNLLTEDQIQKHNKENTESKTNKPSWKNIVIEKVLPNIVATTMTVEGRALITAAERGNLVDIKNLVKKGADINQADYDGRTPAHLASANNHIEIVQYLVGLKASLDMFDRFGRTPLQDALDMGHIKIAQILRMGGATVTNPSLARTLCQAAAIADLDALRTVELTGVLLLCLLFFFCSSCFCLFLFVFFCFLLKVFLVVVIFCLFTFMCVICRSSF